MSDFPNLDKPNVRAYYQKAQSKRKLGLGSLPEGSSSLKGAVIGAVKSTAKSIPGARTLYSMAACYKDNGWEYTRDHFFGKQDQTKKNYRSKPGAGGPVALMKNLSIPSSLTPEEETMQRERVFARNVKISILTPLYNTPEQFLTEMIQSVQGQTYENWELCLSDCSVGEKAETVQKICQEYAAKDPRIVYSKAEEQLGISDNTNRCIAISSGDYFALLDHDDILHKGALYEIAQAVNEQDADFIYSDEAKFETDIAKAFAPNYKPDFAPDELRTHNYICHLTAYSRKLLDACGLYDPACDGSQDHDMVLRLTEKAEHIAHIPKVLYFWRVHEDSVSAGVETKSYAIDAAKKAILDQTRRLGYPVDGEITSIPPYPSLYKIPYHVDSKSSVAIVIWPAEDPLAVRKCITRLDEHQIWHDVEIYVLCSKAKEEAMNKQFFLAPTVWPVHVLTASLQEAAVQIQSDYVLFADAHVEVDSDDYLKVMAGYAQRDDVGAVGGKIWNPKGILYHAGGYLMADGSVREVLPGTKRGMHGYEAMLWHPRNTTLVSGRFLFLKTADLKKYGISEKMGDSWAEDLCVRQRLEGKVNVILPYVECTIDKTAGSYSASRAFQEQYKGIYQTDPYLNPNLIQHFYK